MQKEWGTVWSCVSSLKASRHPCILFVFMVCSVFSACSSDLVHLEPYWYDWKTRTALNNQQLKYLTQVITKSLSILFSILSTYITKIHIAWFTLGSFNWLITWYWKRQEPSTVLNNKIVGYMFEKQNKTKTSFQKSSSNGRMIIIVRDLSIYLNVYVWLKLIRKPSRHKHQNNRPLKWFHWPVHEIKQNIA